MENSTVFSGKTAKGINIVIRYPSIEDVSQMTDYINALSKEKTFITYQGEQETLESETSFLKGKLEEIKNQTGVFLLAIVNNKVIGNSWIGLDRKTNRHIGTLGISVSKKFREEGVGKQLMESIIKEAKQKLLGLEIITLGVFANNSRALNWYKKLGFIEYGSLPKGVKLENEYVDHVYMYKFVN